MTLAKLTGVLAQGGQQLGDLIWWTLAEARPSLARREARRGPAARLASGSEARPRRGARVEQGGGEQQPPAGTGGKMERE
jgi:hypothetical protein